MFIVRVLGRTVLKHRSPPPLDGFEEPPLDGYGDDVVPPLGGFDNSTVEEDEECKWCKGTTAVLLAQNPLHDIASNNLRCERIALFTAKPTVTVMIKRWVRCRAEAGVQF